MAQRSHKRDGFNPLESALEYIDAGMPVFPLRPRMKKPLVKGWQQVASTDPSTVAGLWRQKPDANIGVLCGRGLVVIDADDRSAEAELLNLGIPETTRVRTAKGSHFYFAGDSGNRQRLLPGVDVRGIGGFVVGAGSVHPTGATYEWVIAPSELSPQPLPAVLTELLKRKKNDGGRTPSGQPETELTPDRLIKIGCRNSTLTRMAGSMKLRGLNDDAIEAALIAQNETGCEEPLPIYEIKAICASASQWDLPPIWITDPLWFSRDESLTAHERQALIGLAAHAKNNGWCRVGYRRIADLTGLDKNTVMRAIHSLEEKGWISVKRVGQGRTNRTTILKGRAGSLD